MTDRLSCTTLAASFLVWVISGCSLNRPGIGLADDAGAVSPDATNNDADPNTPDAISNPDARPDCTIVWEPPPTHFIPCAIAPTPTPVILDDGGLYTYDTTDGRLLAPDGMTPISHANVLLDVDGISVRLIWATEFELNNGSTLRIEGTHPLLIASLDHIELNSNASILVNSEFDPVDGARPGAGANSAMCGASTGLEGTDPDNGGNGEGGGGGGGGGFASMGGTGGIGRQGGPQNPGGMGGDVVSAPTGIRGGCAGGKGGRGDQDDCGGIGGPGGGAVQLTARSMISIDGVVHAGGSGGQGAQPDSIGGRRCGGGGGGSGGMIGLEAPNILLTSNAVLAANGGGGGGGSNNAEIPPGTDGTPDGQVPAGSQGEQNGNGGDGGYRAVPDGQPGAPGDRGGGGAGGGMGYVVTRGSVESQGATLSPAPTEL